MMGMIGQMRSCKAAQCWALLFKFVGQIDAVGSRLVENVAAGNPLRIKIIAATKMVLSHRQRRLVGLVSDEVTDLIRQLICPPPENANAAEYSYHLGSIPSAATLTQVSVGALVNIIFSVAKYLHWEIKSFTLRLTPSH